MYPKETLKKIADVLKLDVSVFEANLKSDKEETLEVPTLFTEEDKNTFGTNRFNEGKRAATEILVKDLKVKHGLDFEGKSVDTMLEAFKEKSLADAKIEPDKQVSTLKNEKKALQDQVTSLTGEKEKLTKEYNDKLFHVETKNQILSFIPDNTIIPKEDLVELFMNRHRVTQEDNSVVVYKGDQILKDNVLNPIPLKNVVSQFSEGYIKKNGMGGGDDINGGTKGNFKTMSAFMDHCKKNNIDPMGEKGQKLLIDNKKAVATFDENS